MRIERKNIASIITFAAAALFLTAGLLTAGGLPCEILIENDGYTERLRSGVPFDHESHSGEHNVRCDACHHDYRDGRNVWTNCMQVQKCIDCHDPRIKQGDVDMLHIAYHKNCRTCHVEIGNDRKAPYRQCGGCHR